MVEQDWWLLFLVAEFVNIVAMQETAVAGSLAFTIEQMAKIDKAYQKAFGQRG